MNNQRSESLLKKYLAGQCTPEEQAIVESWYYEISGKQKDNLPEPDYLTMKQDIFNAIHTGEQQQPGRITRIWPRIAAAAIAIVTIGAGLFYYYDQSVKNEQYAAYAHDVEPGRQGATLTLANGKKILINDALAGNIASQSGVRITKAADGQVIYEVTDQQPASSDYNTLSTSAGEQTRVRLPDGSLVYLNSASSLKYPVSFSRSAVRRVSLTGEGYFEISKSFISIGGERTRQSFVVESRGQQVEVLGTHFNVNSYVDEPAVATTLLEGSVKVSQGGKDVILKPGEQAVNLGNTIAVSPVDTESITDWKDGDFYFEHVEFRSVMRKIGRWYNVEIIYDASVPDNITSNGLISRNNKLSEVLKSIEKAGEVHFKIQGNKVYVTK